MGDPRGLENFGISVSSGDDITGDEDVGGEGNGGETGVTDGGLSMETSGDVTPVISAPLLLSVLEYVRIGEGHSASLAGCVAVNVYCCSCSTSFPCFCCKKSRMVRDGLRIPTGLLSD